MSYWGKQTSSKILNAQVIQLSSAVAVNSSPFSAQTYQIRVISPIAAWISIGTSTTSAAVQAAGNVFIAANTAAGDYFSVTPGQTISIVSLSSCLDRHCISCGDVMSEEQLYGIAEREQSAGYEPMPLARPLPRETFDEPASAPDPYQPLSPKDAAELLKDPANRPVFHEEAPTEQPPTPIEYLEQRGERAGQRMAENQTVSPEQAAHDLASYRESIGQTIKDAEDQSVRDAIDALRANDPQPGHSPDAELPQQQAAQETGETRQAEPAATTAEDEVAVALRNPKVLAAVQEQVGQYQQAAERSRQEYEAGLEANTRLALAGLFSMFPELQGVPAQGLAVAIQTINKTAPERGAAISRYIDNVSALLNNTFQVQERQQRAQQEQYQQNLQRYASQMAERFNRGAADEDAKFEAHCKSLGITSAQLLEVRKEALAGLREAGLSDDQISRLWHSDWNMRSFAAQKMMLESALYRMSRRGLAEKIRNPVPPSQRPGTSGQFVDAHDYSTRELSAKLSHTGDIKDATRLVLARRAQKR